MKAQPFIDQAHPDPNVAVTVIPLRIKTTDANVVTAKTQAVVDAILSVEGVDIIDDPREVLEAIEHVGQAVLAFERARRAREARDQ